jgi:hypothetical protein
MVSCRNHFVGIQKQNSATADQFSSRNAQRQIHTTISFVNAARELAGPTNISKAVI